MSDYNELLDDLDQWCMVQPRAAKAIRTLLDEISRLRAELEAERQRVSMLTFVLMGAIDALEEDSSAMTGLSAYAIEPRKRFIASLHAAVEGHRDAGAV